MDSLRNVVLISAVAVLLLLSQASQVNGQRITRCRGKLTVATIDIHGKIDKIIDVSRYQMRNENRIRKIRTRGKPIFLTKVTGNCCWKLYEK